MGDPLASVWYLPAGTKNAAIQTSTRTRKRTVNAVGKRNCDFGADGGSPAGGMAVPGESVIGRSSIRPPEAASPGSDELLAAGRRRSEPLDEDAVPQPAVTDGELAAVELPEHRSDDQRPREDHRGPRRLEPDDRAPLVGGSTPVELDLAIDLLSVEDRSVDDFGVVGGELVLHRREVREGAAHADESVGARAPVEL